MKLKIKNKTQSLRSLRGSTSCGFWPFFVFTFFVCLLFPTESNGQAQEPFSLHFDDLQIETDGSGELEVYLYNLLPLGAFTLGFSVPPQWQVGEVEPGDAIESLIGGSNTPEFWLAGTATDPNEPSSMGVTVLCILTDSSNNLVPLMPGIDNCLVEVSLTPPQGTALGSYEVSFKDDLVPSGSQTNLPIDLVLVDHDGSEYSPDSGVELNDSSIEIIPPIQEREFIRGDLDDSGHLNLTDSILLLSWLFFDDTEPGCIETADINNDDNLNLVDPIQLLFYLFLSQVPPAEPLNNCGIDPNTQDALTCEEYDSCP